MNFVDTIDERVPVRRALISVFNKRGLDLLVPGLLRINPSLSILSTGGSYVAVAAILGAAAARAQPGAAQPGAAGAGAGSLRQVSDYTGQPEMQGGLVKTLDFKIYLGLLSETYNPEHSADLERTGAEPIDLVVVNLYPFKETIAHAGVTPEQARANIDVGGPCMLRAAAKNFLRVAAVVDPADYQAILAELEAGGGALSLATRFRLAQKAFAATAEYDRAIASYMGGLQAGQVAACYPNLRPGGKA
jgi:phosphoribosylaminoimidazolecarboxamide formyltransferase/IMP cyclohydrolase